jgi:hypothetical protein
VTPLVAVCLDGAIHFSTGAEEQKELNVRASPNVALTTGCNEWHRGLDVVVEGTAVRQTNETTLPPPGQSLGPEVGRHVMPS